jgi:tetratricopeptide (TPR) repeat protein
VSIDTLRADAVGAYGNARAETPWIDRLAREGVRFTDVHAHNVVTLPSHVNILSGRYPLAHGVRDNSGFRVPKDTPTMATLLKARGYATGGFVSAFVLGARFGLDLGFDTYDDRIAGGEWQRRFLIPERRAVDTVAEALRWMGKAGGSPTFSFVHLYEPHFPYEPPEPFASRFRADPYHGEVAAADAALEPLLRPILEKGAAARTLVILTSDHGEGLGDHGESTHGLFAYESTLRVPLVVWAPGLFRPHVVSEPVRHVDLLPTLLDVVSAPIPEGLPGRSLLPLLARRGEGSGRTSYFEALSASLNRRWAPLHGLREGRLKFIDLPLPELYDLEADPAEARNLVASRPQDLERLRGRLAALRVEDRGIRRVAENRETVERLRALGYVSGRAEPKAEYTEDDDPKRLVDIDTRLSEMLSLYHAGRVDEAIGVGRDVLRRRPDTDLAHLQLAYLERDRGNLDGAIAEARQAVALRRTDTESIALLGVYLTEAGRGREAVALLEPWAKGPDADLDVLTGLGMALASTGRPEAALATLLRAREEHPRNATVLVNIATVHLLQNDLTHARQAFEAALDIDPNAGRAHNGLGVIAARERRLPEAMEHWRRAVALNAGDYRTLFNLGSMLWGAGRREEARPYLEAYLRAAPSALESRDIARVRAILGTGAAPSR